MNKRNQTSTFTLREIAKGSLGRKKENAVSIIVLITNVFSNFVNFYPLKISVSIKII